jgi:hypothetical protein
MQITHWVLVPETFHKKPADLKNWATKAYEQCSVLEKKEKKPTVAKKKASVKNSKKKVSSRVSKKMAGS